MPCCVSSAHAETISLISPLSAFTIHRRQGRCQIEMAPRTKMCRTFNLNRAATDRAGPGRGGARRSGAGRGGCFPGEGCGRSESGRWRTACRDGRFVASAAGKKGNILLLMEDEKERKWAWEVVTPAWFEACLCACLVFPRALNVVWKGSVWSRASLLS